MSQFVFSSHSPEKDGIYGIISLINTNATLKVTLTSFNRKGEVLGVFYKEFPGEHFIDQASCSLSYDGKVAIFETIVKNTIPQLNKIHILTINEGNFDFCYTDAEIYKVNISRDNQTIHLLLTISELIKDIPTRVVRSKTIVLNKSLNKMLEIYPNIINPKNQEGKLYPSTSVETLSINATPNPKDLNTMSTTTTSINPEQQQTIQRATPGLHAQGIQTFNISVPKDIFKTRFVDFDNVLDQHLDSHLKELKSEITNFDEQVKNTVSQISFLERQKEELEAKLDDLVKKKNHLFKEFEQVKILKEIRSTKP